MRQKSVRQPFQGRCDRNGNIRPQCCDWDHMPSLGKVLGASDFPGMPLQGKQKTPGDRGVIEVPERQRFFLLSSFALGCRMQ